MSIKLNPNFDKRVLILIAILIPVGFYTKLYQGPYQHWFNNSITDTFYVIFWIAIVNLFKRDIKPLTITLWVFIFTCLIEFSQLLNVSWLNDIRETFIGKTLLGTTFVATDFIYYLAGAIIGYFIIKYFQKTRKK